MSDQLCFQPVLEGIGRLLDTKRKRDGDVCQGNQRPTKSVQVIGLSNNLFTSRFGVYFLLGTLMRRTLMLLFLAATLVSTAEAKTVIAPSKQKSRSLASIVAEVEITKSTPLVAGAEQCAFEYEAKVLFVWKGQLAREAPFRFGVLGGLDVGKRYVLYLRNLATKTEFVYVMEERSADSAESLALFEQCPLVTPIPMFFRADRVTNE